MYLHNEVFRESLALRFCFFVISFYPTGLRLFYSQIRSVTHSTSISIGIVLVWYVSTIIYNRSERIFSPAMAAVAPSIDFGCYATSIFRAQRLHKYVLRCGCQRTQKQFVAQATLSRAQEFMLKYFGIAQQVRVETISIATMNIPKPSCVKLRWIDEQRSDNI